jgi:TIR domain
MPDIFISYRRDDSSGYAGRLYDQISAHFGEEHVFMDVADIGPGSDFVSVIEQKVGTCDALIALIGKNWLTLKDDQKRPRLGNAEDFVSVEVLAALKRKVEVIPVLVGGAKMPSRRELPESLQPLSRHQALEISDAHFTRDVQDLIAALEKGVGQAPFSQLRWLKPALIAAVLLVGLIAAVTGVRSWQKGRPQLRGSATQAAAGGPVLPDGDSASPSQKATNGDISGNWKAVLQKNGATFETFFTFEVSGDKLFGRVIYPTGEAGILNGTISNERFSFITRHTPQFAEQEATITVDGHIVGDEIEIVLQDNDGFAKGVARRVPQIGNPKVLTR